MTSGTSAAAEPELTVITGISASGKTTVGALLAERLHPSVFIEGDVVRRMVRRGRVEMGPSPSPTALAQLRLRYRHTAMLADSYRAHGFHVVVEDVIIGPVLDEFLRYLTSRPLHLIVLVPNPPVVAHREAHREKTAYRDPGFLTHLDQVLRTRTPRHGLWLDNGRMSAHETVDEILHRRGEARVGARP